MYCLPSTPIFCSNSTSPPNYKYSISKIFLGPSFLDLARRYSLDPSSARVPSRPKIGFGTFSPSYKLTDAYDRVHFLSTLAFNFAREFGPGNYRDEASPANGKALHGELRRLVEYAIEVARAQGQQSAIHASIPSLRVRITIQPKLETILRTCILRPDQEVVHILVALEHIPASASTFTSPLNPEEQKKEEAGGLKALFGCWKWNMVKIGPATCFWGCGLDLGDEEGKEEKTTGKTGKKSRGLKGLLYCGRKDEDEEEWQGGEEKKPLLIDL